MKDVIVKSIIGSLVGTIVAIIINVTAYQINNR